MICSGLRRGGATVVASIVLVLASSAGVAFRNTSATAAAGTIRLVRAPQTVAPGGRINLELSLPDGTPAPTEVEVSVRPVSDTAEDLAAEVGDGAFAPTDTVMLTGTSITVTDRTVSVSIPTEKTNTQSNLLALTTRGTYAVRVTVPTVGSLTVPIIRRGNETSEPVPVAIVLGLDAPLSIQPDGSSSISDATRASMRALAAFLGTATVPVAVSVRPEVVDSLLKSELASDRELVAALAEAFGRQRLLSSPYLHVDPSAAANADAAADFTAQLRLGEDTLSNALRRLPDRRIWVATEPLSPAGAQLVRNLGAAVIVQAAGVASDRPAVAVSDGGNQAVLVPSDINVALAKASDDPVRAAQTIAVGLLRAKQGESRPAIVIMPDLVRANPALLAALAALLSDSEDLQAADIEQVGTGTVLQPDAKAPLVADFSAAHTRRAKLIKLVTATAAVLPTSDARRIDWGIRADVLLDTRLPDDDRAAYETQLRADVLDVQSRVIIQAPKAVNLSDRNANIPLTIENTNDVPVTVTVRLVSGKLRVPAENEEITIEPGATEFVRIQVRALSSGRFPVTAQMLAPGTKTVVGKSAVVNVRVGRLTGLGIVVTFAAGLVLLSWWVQHFRRRLRKEETAELERRKLAGLPIDEVDDVLVDSSSQTERTVRRRRPQS